MPEEKEGDGEEEGAGEEGAGDEDEGAGEEGAAEEEQVEIEEEKSDEELEREVEDEEKENEDLPPEAEEDLEEEDEEEENEDEEEEFDRDLYDIRKLYRRPEDDKMRQEEIAKIRDAIDRCLAVYKNEKKRERIREQRKEKERQRLLEIKRKGEEREAQKREEAQRLGANSYFGVLGSSYDLGGGSAKPIVFSTEPAVEKKPSKPRKKKVNPDALPSDTIAVTDIPAAELAPKKRRGRPRKETYVPKDPNDRNLDLNPVREKEKRKVSGFGFGIDINDALGGTSFDIVDTPKSGGDGNPAGGES